MSEEISWDYSAPRNGVAGWWDRLIGPDATLTEQLIGIIPGIIAAGAVVGCAEARGIEWSGLQRLIAAILAFDVVGGIATNGTSSAKRWYHRAGKGFWDHFGFILLHLLHIFVVAWLFMSLNIPYFLSVAAYLLPSAAIILSVPRYIQRSVALVLLSGGIFAALYVFPEPPGMEWFAPLLYVKLLVSHLVVEEPYARGAVGDTTTA